MKVTFKNGIESLSGKSGNMIFKTYRRRDGKIETRAYLRPLGGYERSAPVTEKEMACREKFAAFQRFWRTLPPDNKMRYHDLWKQDGFAYRGKRYGTLRGYVMARYYALDLLA